MEETRDRGILNTRQRQYLRRRGTDEAEIEPKSEQERAIRQSIRGHIRNTWLDFPLLVDRLEKRDRGRHLFPEVDTEVLQSEWATQSTYEISVATKAAFAFFIINDPTIDEVDGQHLTDTLENAIKQAALKQGRTVENVTVEIDVDYGEDVDDLTHDLMALSNDQLRQLHMAGELSQEDYYTIMTTRLDDQGHDTDE